MKVIDKYTEENILISANGQKVYRSGEVMPIDDSIALEHMLDVNINTIPTLRLVCSPSDLVELVLGRLITERVVAGVDDIEQIYLCEYGNRAEVMLVDAGRANFSAKHIDTVQSCCTSNKILNSYFENNSRPENVVPINISEDEIFEMCDKFSSDSPNHKRSFGTHSCYIKDTSNAEAEILYAEDLGRHNALDKVVGKAVLAGFNLQTCILFSSGRLPLDMIMKVISARIPIIASKAVPTDVTIDLAKEFNLGLICSAYPDSYVVFNDTFSK